jgi:hypothetical protein
VTVTDPGRKLTRDEIAQMKPNEPTPRRTFGTDASLSWSEQLEHIRKACSKAVTRLSTMLELASEGSEVVEIVRALSQAQSMAMKATGGDGDGKEPTDAQLMKASRNA